MSEVLTPERKINGVEAVVRAFPEVAGLQAYEYFRSEVGEQKETFISGDQEALVLTYPDLTLGSIMKIKDPMLSALKTLMPGEVSDKSEALYQTIEYRYSELFMMDMSRIMISSEYSDDERKEAEEWFKMTNEGLYGKPQLDVFSALAKKEISAKTTPYGADQENVRFLKEELAGLCGPIEETDYQPFSPSEELVTKVGDLVHERFDHLVEHIDPEKVYEVGDIVDAVHTALDNIGGVELGWEVVVVPNSSAIAVSAHQKRIEVGENRLAIKGAKLRGRILHEVCVHAGRSMNAERAGWLSAAYGQDGYLDFEESMATAMEDAYAGEFKSHGENYYLIAGLAYGLDNHSPRDFRETFEVMWRVNALGRVKEGRIDDESIRKARSAAFTSCLRLFRGTTGRQKGVVYLKDLAYFKGQEAAWSVLENIETQAEFDAVFAGKLDNTREDHQHIAEQILAFNK